MGWEFLTGHMYYAHHHTRLTDMTKFSIVGRHKQVSKTKADGSKLKQINEQMNEKSLESSWRCCILTYQRLWFETFYWYWVCLYHHCAKTHNSHFFHKETLLVPLYHFGLFTIYETRRNQFNMNRKMWLHHLASVLVHCGPLLPEVGADVLLQHAAESRPQVVESPVKRVDALAQGVTPEGTDLAKRWPFLVIDW